MLPYLRHGGGFFFYFSSLNNMYVCKTHLFCCICRFSLLKEHLIEFNQLAMANAEGSDEMLNRVMTKDNIGLAALLQTQAGVFDSSGTCSGSCFL